MSQILPCVTDLLRSAARTRHVREFHATMRRLFALQLEAFLALAEYLGDPLGSEPRKRRTGPPTGGRTRDVARAAEWLGLPDGAAPKLEEYERAQELLLGLLKRKTVIDAWEKWDNFKRALTGDWVPETPASQRNRVHGSGSGPPTRHAGRVGRRRRLQRDHDR
jgi:hypothetical protein